MAATRSTRTRDVPIPRLRLYINIDHVATLRQARKTDEPDPVAAAALCEDAGADGITAHLREDRRHIQDADVERLTHAIQTVFNLEMAATNEMVRIAQRLQPYQVTLVPERREEITTEGGLNVEADPAALAETVGELTRAGIRVSLFIDPDPRAIATAHSLKVAAIELHTGRYANAASTGGPRRDAELAALAEAARLGRELGLAVHAGHGLTVRNVGPVAAIGPIEELNIGHSIVSRAIFVGLAEAVREMRVAMDTARSSHYPEIERSRTERR
jgi:pyridoxine 5-phosphate synthase